MTGTTIAQYKVLEKLGEGGMGAVYKAEDTRLSRLVALKFLSTPPTEGGELESRFLHEARAAAALDHPNICGVYEINVADGRLYMAMPLIDGESLEKRIEAGPRPIKEALTIAIQTAEGLEEAHSKGIVHRDIKPGNILLVNRDRGRLQVKLLDFGLARLNQATKLTREGAQLGTAPYMSPEQVEGAAVDLRSDVWSLGVVFYEMVAGQMPFPAEYEQALFYGILNEQPEPLTAIRSRVPMELERIVNKCLAKSADQRFQSMADLLVDLNALLDTLGRSAPGVSRASAIATPPPAAAAQAETRRAIPAWAWLLAGLPLGALAMWALWPATPRAPASQQEYEFERVTWDGQFNGFPAISPDGTLLAFASDRAGRGDLDIWIKQVNGGSLIRLTDGNEDELQPSFSPDGSQIVFYRWGEGVYTIPALGGEPYFVTAGDSAAFAPDGKHIAYISAGALHATPVSMGEPKMLLSGLENPSAPLWTPDGKYVLLAARISGGEYDWWAVPEDGSAPLSLGAYEVFQREGRAPPAPDKWSWLGESLLFENGDGDLATVPFEPNPPAVVGSPRQLTIGAGVEVLPTASSRGSIAFMNAWQRRDIWSLPLAGGEPERLTSSESSDTAGDLSPDGRHLVYLSNRLGDLDIWTLSLPGGQETALTSDDAQQRYPLISRDGERVAYLSSEAGKAALYLRPYAGGVGRLVCADCGAPSDWSPLGDRLLFDRADPPSVGVLDPQSGEASTLLAADGCTPQMARYSPDGKAVAFRLDCAEGGGGLFVAPVSSTGLIPRENWIEITGDRSDSHPAWAPAGDRLYFTSRRLGSLDIWSERLNPGTRGPLGEPQVVRRFPLARYSMDLMSEGDRRLSIDAERITFTLSEAGGSVWLMKPR